MKPTKHIVCYSGGHSSAVVALNVVARYGKENIILLNHDINSFVEHEDIKRFKQEVADLKSAAERIEGSKPSARTN